MIADLPPGLILILGALLVPFVPAKVRRVYMLALPVLGLIQLLMLPNGMHAQLEVFGHTLTFLRVDGLAMAFGIIFLIAVPGLPAVVLRLSAWLRCNPPHF